MKILPCLLLLVASIPCALGCDAQQAAKCTTSDMAHSENANKDDLCRYVQEFVDCLNRECSNQISNDFIEIIKNIQQRRGFQCDLHGVNEAGSSTNKAGSSSNTADSSSNIAGRLGSSSLVLMVIIFFLSIFFLHV